VQLLVQLIERHLSQGGMTIFTGHQEISITGSRALQL